MVISELAKYLLAVLITTLSSICLGSEVEGASDFFEEYRLLHRDLDASVIDLYLDEAKVYASIIDSQGNETRKEYSGEEWKRQLIHIMPNAKKLNDVSTFENILISKYGKGYKITASRYSKLKCYLDEGYYMVIVPDFVGHLYIKEEYVEIQSASNC